MPDLHLQMPDLESIYDEAGLRTDRTLHKGREVDAFTSFYSFGDFKREVRALILVPIVCAMEAVDQLTRIVGNLMVSAVQLATLDGRGFDTLGNAFTHFFNAIALVGYGIAGFLSSAFTLFTRTVSTAFDMMGQLFENEPTANEAPTTGYSYTTTDYHTTTNYSTASNQSTYTPSAPSYSAARGQSFFGATARPTLTSALRDLDNLEGLTADEKAAMARDMRNSGEFASDDTYSSYYTPRF